MKDFWSPFVQNITPCVDNLLKELTIIQGSLNFVDAIFNQYTDTSIPIKVFLEKKKEEFLKAA